MKLRVRAGQHSGRLELGGGEETLGALRSRLRMSYLPALGYSPDLLFSITLNGSDSLTEDERSLESLGIVSGDLIVIVTEDLPAPEQPAPQAAAETKDGGYKRQKYEGDAAAAGAHDAAEAEEAALRCSPEPMLCSEAADGKIPHSLEALYPDCRCASDALVVITHLLMLETGYKEEGVTHKVSSMPMDWRSGDGVYKLHYSHPLCGDSSAALLCVPMGKLLIINAALTIGGELRCVKRLQLPTDSYITFPQEDRSVASVYRDLQKLSRLFKDQVVYPLLAATRQALGLPDVFGLVVLPPELKLRIFRLLDVRSILSLGVTCKNLHADVEDPSLWRFLYRRDFKDGSERDPHHTDWKELYKRKQTQLRVLCLRRHPYNPDFPPPDFPPFCPDPLHPDQSPPNFPYPPGIIGGEYDQRPLFPFPRDPLSLLNPRRPYDPGLFQLARPRFNPPLPGHFGESSRSRRGPFL
ncbi:F-box only protein 7 isoform X2 [Phyllobates terribilis]|uniref:F-box only protein 7 isoform X2 n=1 Tax=Phyllobates terribilis TaxID=111132 RepID=UPI003CCAB2CF